MTDKYYLKVWREIKWFDGQREVAIKRDGNMCVRCRGITKLSVHHKDWKGRGYKGKINNNLSNLETLCTSCHRKAHTKRDRYRVAVAKLWDKSDREIARRLNISGPTVGIIRKELTDKLLIGARPFSIDPASNSSLLRKAEKK